MITFLRLIIIASSLVFTPLVTAHEGHEHAKQLDQASAIEAASDKIGSLIEEGQLDPFWSAQETTNAQIARVNGLQNWIVSYLDSGSRQRLELVFSMTGEFVSFSKIPVSDTAAN